MRFRLFFSAAASRLGRRWLNRYTAMFALATAVSPLATAEDSQGYYTDPATGYVYREVTRTIERPVVETQMQTREKTVYRPETVTETKPESRTVYTPVVEYRWVPKLEGRWNPFRQPTVGYHYEPQTRWEARSETVHRTTRRTEWVAEKRQVTVPQRLTRMEREQKTEYELVGRVAPRTSPNRSDRESSAIASRLRPLDQSDRVQPIGGRAPATGSPRSLANRERLASQSRQRSSERTGLPATDLTVSPQGTYAQPLPPVGGTIATLPAPPLWR